MLLRRRVDVVLIVLEFRLTDVDVNSRVFVEVTDIRVSLLKFSSQLHLLSSQARA